MHAVTKKIVSWAKRSMLASSRRTLTVPDLLSGVYALRAEAPVSEHLTTSLGSAFAWPESVVALHTAASSVEATESPYPMEQPVQELIQRVHARDVDLPPELMLRELLALDHTAIRELKGTTSTASTPGGTASTAGVPGAGTEITRRLETMLASSLRMATTLNQTVLGQEQAVAMLGDAWFKSQIATAEGPRGIFTLLGPPGVGKTLLAEQFAQRMNEFVGAAQGGQVAFRRFDLAEYAGPQAHEQLFGVAKFYKESRPGTLTGFVHEHPVAVILLDEIEKAHPITLQSLLAVLDKGEAEDKSLEQTVSFRQVWFVITTNLGQDLFSATNRAGVLSGATVSSDLLLDVLTATRGDPREGRPDTPGLSPEMVSRLAKGGVVVLNKLEIRHYMSLVMRTFAARFAGGEVPRVTLTDEVAFLLVLSLLPRIDARRVTARANEWSAQVVQDAWEACSEAVCATGHGDLTVTLRCGDAAKAWMDSHMGGAPVRILLIDEDDHVRALLAREAEHLGIEVCRASHEDDQVEAIRHFKADLVLLDLCIDELPDSPRVDTGTAILGNLRSARPDLPVWLFAENAGQRATFGTAGDRIVRRGGARGFLPASADLTTGAEIDNFLARFREIIQDFRYDRVMRAFQRAHKNIALRLSYRWLPQERTIVAEVAFAREEVVFSAADRRAAIQFSGIPEQRFADVVGLERAKKRLSQIVAWLRDPGALTVLGGTLPRGFLLAGPPGTGKTLLARALAGEAGLPFLALAASELQSMWVGESEARIRELFARAQEYAPAIVFIDEIDGIARARTGLEQQHTASTLNQLLACMDGFKPGDRPVFVLAATNHPDSLDRAILRPGRFDEVVPVDLPNAKARRRFFELRLAKVKHEAGLDLDRLVGQTGGSSPAELDRIVREAIYACVAAGRATVTATDLADAIRLVRFGAESQEIKLSEKDRRTTAYHEAGHAVLHLRLFPELPIDWLTIVPSENKALGFLAWRPDEESHSQTVDAVECRLAVMLAGREAERLVGGDSAVTSGASSDLQRATGLAAAAVGAWGFDRVWGPVVHGALPEGKTSVSLDERVRDWLERARERTVAELVAHRDMLDALANALMTRESLDGDEIKVILDDRVRA